MSSKVSIEKLSRYSYVSIKRPVLLNDLFEKKFIISLLNNQYNLRLRDISIKRTVSIKRTL